MTFLTHTEMQNLLHACVPPPWGRFVKKILISINVNVNVKENMVSVKIVCRNQISFACLWCDAENQV